MLHGKRGALQPSTMSAWSKMTQAPSPAGRPICKSGSAHRLLAAENAKQAAAARSDASTGASSGMSRSHSAGAGLAVYASALKIDMLDDADEDGVGNQSGGSATGRSPRADQSAPTPRVAATQQQQQRDEQTAAEP